MNTPGHSEDSTLIYATRQSEVASAKIYYAVEQRQGLVVVTGEEGMGKTTLARQILGRWESDPAIVAACLRRPDVRLTSGFLRQVLNAFGLETHYLASDNETVLCNFLRERQEEGQTCVLVIDDAHCLSPKACAALHRLLAQQTTAGPLLQVVLFAQPALARKLHDRTSLGRHVGSRATLDELTFDDALALLRHRLRHVGADFDLLFPPARHRPLYAAAAGNPRGLCQMCDQALAGYAHAGYTGGYATNLGTGGYTSVTGEAQADGYFWGAVARSPGEDRKRLPGGHRPR